MACACSKRKPSAGKPKWLHLAANGSLIKAYDDEVDARMAVAAVPGSTLKVA